MKYGLRSRLNRGGSVKKKKLSRIVAILILIGVFILLPVIRIQAKAKELNVAAKELKQAYSKNDINLLEKELNEFSGKYDQFQKSARWVYWMAFIPYVADFKNGVEGGHYLVEAGKEMVVAIKPHADLIGFKKGETSFVEKSAEDRLQTAVLTLDQVVKRIDPISENIKEAEKRIDKINPNRYPKKFGKRMVRADVANFKAQVLGVSKLFVDAQPLLKQLPEILGKNEKKTYLILFQNDKERRATGGFLTSYAIFTVQKGKIEKEVSDDIYNLDNSISSHPRAPDEILTYHKGVNQFNLRDSNLSPDLVESIKLFNSLYEDSPQEIDYDGIIAVDSTVLVDMLTVFGDTEAGGIVFSAKNDERCDCPQVIYRLFDIVDRPVNYIKEDRKGILGQLMEALLFKVLGFSPSRYWGPFLANSLTNLEQKHILLYFTDKELQRAVEKLNFAGRIRDFEGDYLHINNVNFAGAKSNLFVSEDILSETKTSRGTIERKVEITYRNPYPHSDCNLERGGLCLNATLRNWIRVYVPKGSKLVSFNGSETEVKTYDELGKTVFEGFLRVNPLGRAQAVITYTLPKNISSKDYELYIQRQPGADTQKVKVQIDGKTVYEKPFLKDEIINKKS